LNYAPRHGEASPANPSHRLHRLELEIETEEELFARRLIDRLSRLHREELEGLLDRVFSELSPPQHWHRIERLELELGTFAGDDLELQLPQRLEQALRRALANQIPPSQPQSSPQSSPPSPRDSGQAASPTEAAAGPAHAKARAVIGDRDLELLALFSATGTLPWWAPRHDRQLITVAIEQALAQPPQALAPLLRQLAAQPGANPVALGRLLAAASPQQRPRLEAAVAAALGAIPDAAVVGGDAGVGREASVTAGAVVMAARQWQSGTAASATSSSQPGLKALELLAIYAVTGRWPAAAQWPNPPYPTPGQPNAPVDNAQAADARVGVAQVDSQNQALDSSQRQALEAAIEQALALPPQALAPLLRQLAAQPGANPVALGRLLAAASPQQRPRLETAVAAALGAAPEPEAATTALQQTTAVEQATAMPEATALSATTAVEDADAEAGAAAEARQRGLAIDAPEQPAASANSASSASPASPAPQPTLTPPPTTSLSLPPPLALQFPKATPMPAGLPAGLPAELSAELPSQRRGQGSKPVPSPPARAAEAAEVSAVAPPPRTPAETPAPQPTAPALQPTASAPPNRTAVDDELAVDGAGLVLLWPFFETLFSRLELLTEAGLFGGESQRQRAMALLGFLVDGDPDPPEWRLTLAKLLCGALPDGPYGLETPLSEAEQAEAEGLLQAVLVHGQGLFGEEPADLRQQMLQRPGLLSTRPGAWVLQLERRQGDELVPQLPWSCEWIRLGWMEHPLQVIW
jgi:hypothetical protein